MKIVEEVYYCFLQKIVRLKSYVTFFMLLYGFFLLYLPLPSNKKNVI